MAQGVKIMPTPREEELGNALRTMTRKFPGTYVERLDQAAQAMEHKFYRDLSEVPFTGIHDVPVGTRSYLGLTGSIQARKRAVETDTTGPSRMAEINEEQKAEQLAYVKDAWQRDILRTPSLQHALHPEDERSIVDFFEEEELAQKSKTRKTP